MTALDTFIVENVSISGFNHGLITERAGVNTPLISNVSILNSVFYNNTAGGITLGGVVASEISECATYNNSFGSAGITVLDSDQVVIANCTSNDNKGQGIVIENGASNVTVSGCSTARNFYASLLMIAKYNPSLNNNGSVENVFFSNCTSESDGYGYGFAIVGVHTYGNASASDVDISNFHAVSTNIGATYEYFGSNTSVFNALWLVGNYSLTTLNSTFAVPTANYTSNLKCSSAAASVCMPY